ncbi:putative membrane protein [Propionispora sp. 2/2-37]|uniref:efflux RND transporter periplasmic adaptor subunit n=1 Tax=Propionispora sp. 2/2-37 TaxID=1677858 RepID=UPI0006BB972C|nr:efflux RND transporter periplasmic adaptor subunit [Propionispora sp. 2/2-37]CUH94983.1 putative membrane protein [Propionispora sp. 2/2-37]
MKGFRFKFWMIPVLLFIILMLIFRSGVFSEKKLQTQEDSGVAVRVAAAQYQEVVPGLELSGTIEGKTSATISAKISGRVDAVLVEEGQQVKIGDPLVSLESVELKNAVRTAQDAVTKAQVNYDLALADYNRYQKLFSQGAVSKQQLDTAEAKRKSAEADLSSAAASLNNAKQQLGYGVVTSPVDGVVANKAVTVGQVVSPGAALMVVQDISQIHAVVNIEQKDIGRVKVGQTAKVRVDAYADKVFAGTVEGMNPEAGSGNRMFRTKIKVDNADGALRSGMFAKIRLDTGDPVQVLSIPQAAVLQKQGLYYVFSVEEGKAVRHQVEIGDVTDDMIQIKDGLQAGDQVIISGVNQMKDGQIVKVTP